MKKLTYVVLSAARNLRQDLWVNLMTMFSIAVGLFLIGLFAVSLWSLQVAMRQWSEGFGLVVYLEEGITAPDLKALQARIRRQPEVAELKYKSPDEALEELARELGQDMLAGLQDNPLPPTLELRLKDERPRPESMRALADRIGTMNGVDDVQFGDRWVQKATDAADRMNLFGLVLIASLAIGIVFMIANTVRILFHRRQDEVEIQKLLGATKGFIRLPFLLEGGLLGGLSGVLAALALGVAFSSITTTYRLLGFMDYPRLLGGVIIACVGTLLGIAGSLSAVGRIRL